MGLKQSCEALRIFGVALKEDGKEDAALKVVHNKLLSLENKREREREREQRQRPATERKDRDQR